MSYTLLQVRKGKEQSIFRKHPWIFSGAIFTETQTIHDGEIVEVQDYKGRFLALGHFQNATIAVRILSFTNLKIDESFFQMKIQQALESRLKIGLLSKENNIFRVCHGEGDGLPGLVIDFYNGVAVIQCHSIGMNQSLKEIASGLKKAFGKKLVAIYSKSADTLPKRMETTDSYIFGNCETPHQAIENGVKYKIDWVLGQKTGFLLTNEIIDFF